MHAFEFRNRSQELFVFVIRAETHDLFLAGTIILASVKENDLTPGMEM